MSASFGDDDAHTPAELGLHRGRRVLGGCALLGLLAWAGLALFRLPQPPPLEAPPPAEAARVVESDEIELVALHRAAPAKRRAKAARTGTHGSPRAAATIEREAVLSAPPLLPAIVETARPSMSRLPAEPGEPAAAPVEKGAEEEAAAAPAVELPDDGNGEAIARAIAAAKRNAVQTCFERELKQTPTLKGTLVVELDLAPPHRVNGVRVTDDLDRPAFTQCVSSTMEQLSFVALNEEVSIRVPYLLSAQAK